MRKNILDRLGKEWIFFDGGTGSILQEKGLQPGELPETWNLSHPEEIIDLHLGYLRAGSHIFNTNTFGANRLKYPDNLDEIVSSAVHLAKEARRRSGREDDSYIALDIGPTGKLLKPMGDLSFDDAVDIFSEVVRIGAREGADLVLIETMNDTYEAKAAVLAAKENCDLPVLLTCVFDASGKMLTGGTPESMVSMFEALGVNALGTNCSLGPEQMIPIVERLVNASHVPVLVNPNAGLPKCEDGKTFYDVDAEAFAGYMKTIAGLGAAGLGGCCGTTPEYIKKEIEAVTALPFIPKKAPSRTVISSFSQVVEIGNGNRPVIIGERINPTGKKRFKQALVEHDIDYIIDQGLQQEDAGADVLDVNVGSPEIDEVEMIDEVITRLQSVLALPLQIDTSDPKAMELALRHYNGKALINSVNGKEEVMHSVFPLVKKYGGVIVGLALDEGGIPETADGRIAIAKKIYDTAMSYGIPKEDVVIDGLCMTISSDPNSALVTLETVRRIRDELGGNSILGVSNISFGLPARELVNSYFFAMALQNGLSCAIINPNNQAMMQAYRSFCALTNQDENFQSFIGAYHDYKTPEKRISEAVDNCRARVLDALGISAGDLVSSGRPLGKGNGSGSFGGSDATGNSASAKDTSSSGSSAQGYHSKLMEAIERGMANPAAEATREALKSRDALDIINSDLVPALDIVGQGFEKGTVFLPQLLMAADAAKKAFAVVKESMEGSQQEIKGKVILATVKGDIHDIGKNIVKVLLENYGYDVIDLGKDVPPETIVDTAVSQDVKLVGLSALMTTTVVNMEETIKQLHEKKPDCKIAVGGAVMTQDYADKIGADCYGRDAMTTVRFADELCEKGLL
ncbi:homocysteine S-methyltransferase family protein [Oribacterium sp. WCC10]|uniref:homocysteine S-methyltransferase family protein n=1 Tax=Oribacterium sp. WCC10 TaxID=1855343 RepID=UPI0008E87CF7|nr:homocysteine S-methyltransferase family protein [Oribacterium sp. WCC10]SFG74564.1 5-methyltetrahydrofolate--homocysteine methyltransferase [Oribacterium sp. WCC10]